MDEQIREGNFCRVKNRIDIIGKVVKKGENFVRLDVPNFRGVMEYPLTLVEFIDNGAVLHEESGVS
ncbi:MAG: hypothetical protein J7L32_03720 [Thermoplasmata archaeon]|nr:MAG: hypothetical protein FE035_00710 [Thermoplasmata archaeon]MCD6468402.1 hypothetical protein [Thermoplasmata archaeon]RLF28026.1 MAG: hypothetical protein DRN01_00940 [Thermoplasmata archaeon]